MKKLCHNNKALQSNNLDVPTITLLTTGTKHLITCNNWSLQKNGTCENLVISTKAMQGQENLKSQFKNLTIILSLKGKLAGIFSLSNTQHYAPGD